MDKNDDAPSQVVAVKFESDEEEEEQQEPRALKTVRFHEDDDDEEEQEAEEKPVVAVKKGRQPRRPRKKKEAVEESGGVTKKKNQAVANVLALAQRRKISLNSEHEVKTHQLLTEMMDTRLEEERNAFCARGVIKREEEEAAAAALPGDDDDESTRADARMAAEDTADAFVCDQRGGGGGTAEERRRQVLKRMSALIDDVATQQAAVHGAMLLAGIASTSRGAAGTSEVSGLTEKNFVLSAKQVEATLALSGDALPDEDACLPCRLPAQSYRIYQTALEECVAQDAAYRERCAIEALGMHGLRASAPLRAPALPRLDVNYCADFLREADVENRERPCANGLNCVCNMNVSGAPGGAGDYQTRRRFVCREFLLPDQLERWYASLGEEQPAVPRLCLPCNRLSTTARVLKNLRTESEPIGDVVQDHTLVFNEPGGYADEYALPMHGDADGKRYLGLVERALLFDVDHYRCVRVRSPHNESIELNAWVEQVTHFHIARTDADCCESTNVPVAPPPPTPTSEHTITPLVPHSRI